MLRTSRVHGCSAFLFVALLVAGTLHAEPKYPADTVVASRGSATVTMQDVDAALIGMTASQRANFMNSPKRIEELIDRLLINQQLANEARTAKLDKDPLFPVAVAQQGNRILTDQLALKLRGEILLGDIELLARERYDVNPDAYTSPARADVRHILISIKERTDADAKARAETVREKVLAGENFIELVKEYSDDRTKGTNDGEIHDGEAEGLVPEFIAAVKLLKTKGQISPLVKTDFGYHVIKLEERYPALPQSFDQVKERIIAELANRMRDTRVKEYIDQLKGMELKATPDVVASLRTRYLPAGTSAEAAVPDSK